MQATATDRRSDPTADSGTTVSHAQAQEPGPGKARRLDLPGMA